MGHTAALAGSSLAIFSFGFWYPSAYAAYYHDNDSRGGIGMLLACVLASFYAVRALASLARWVKARTNTEKTDIVRE
jgi:hypothetical protein